MNLGPSKLIIIACLMSDHLRAIQRCENSKSLTTYYSYDIYCKLQLDFVLDILILENIVLVFDFVEDFVCELLVCNKMIKGFEILRL